jgi:hypothetical protein
MKRTALTLVSLVLLTLGAGTSALPGGWLIAVAGVVIQRRREECGS